MALAVSTIVSVPWVTSTCSSSHPATVSTIDARSSSVRSRLSLRISGVTIHWKVTFASWSTRSICDSPTANSDRLSK